MSAAGLLQLGSAQTVDRAAACPCPDIEKDVGSSSVQADLLYLARQLFLRVPRRRIFFAGTGDEVDVSGLCTRLGTVLSRLLEQKVALVDSAFADPKALAVKNNPWRNSSTDSGQSSEGRVRDYLYRVPAYMVAQEVEQRSPTRDLDLPFAYVLFAGKITDGAAPLFCRASEACVLVVAAHRTHRKAALRAKEILQEWNAQLLGVVLSNRTFPVPECIYLRL